MNIFQDRYAEKVKARSRRNQLDRARKHIETPWFFILVPVHGSVFHGNRLR